MTPVMPVNAPVLNRNPVGIIDIGSNTVRLVVYDGLRRTPMSLFNEKATCALGTGLESTGRLNPAGVPMALDAIERFVRLARAMEVERLDVLATAACRDASDGPEFLAEIERRCGVTVTLLSGEDEANRAAYGVMCAIPDADGLVCDLGGGSLELVLVKDGACGRFTSLPLGVLRLAEHSGGDRAKAAALIEQRIQTVDFLEQARGRQLYVVGGSWRALAQVCIAQMKYPLHVLDNFTLSREKAEQVISLVARQSAKSLEKIKTVSRKRIPNLPLAARLLEHLIQKAQPDQVVFSVYGMREGQFFLNLPDDLRQGDPLISAATYLARAAGRFPEHAVELMDWMQPLFPDEPPELARLRLGACLLGDIFWDEHPDYRGQQAFLRVMRLPFMGLDHSERAGLALAVYYRYASDDSLPMVVRAQRMLDEDRVRRVKAIGAALRLGHTLSGGAPGLLSRTKIERGDRLLVLGVPAGDAVFLPEAFNRRLDRLAQEVGLEGSIVKV